MQERQLKAGSPLYWGVPTSPISDIMVDAIGQVVSQVQGINEAYLPQCFIPGDQEAKQVLVIGVEDGNKIPVIMNELFAKMRLVLPTGQFIDILPFQSSSMPPEARVPACQIILKPDRKPWWKIW